MLSKLVAVPMTAGPKLTFPSYDQLNVPEKLTPNPLSVTCPLLMMIAVARNLIGIPLAERQEGHRAEARRRGDGDRVVKDQRAGEAYAGAELHRADGRVGDGGDEVRGIVVNDDGLAARPRVHEPLPDVARPARERDDGHRAVGVRDAEDHRRARLVAGRLEVHIGRRRVARRGLLVGQAVRQGPRWARGHSSSTPVMVLPDGRPVSAMCTSPWLPVRFWPSCPFQVTLDSAHGVEGRRRGGGRDGEFGELVFAPPRERFENVSGSSLLKML